MDNKLNKIIILCLLILLGAVNGVRAVDASAQVDIYPQGIDVTWVLAAEPEMTIILPSSFSSDRICYKVGNGAEVKLLEAVYQPAGDWIPSALAYLYDSINQTQTDIDKIEVELKGVEQTIAYLSESSICAQPDNPLDYFIKAQELRIELEQQRQVLTKAKTQADKKLRDLNQQLSQCYGGDIDRVLKIKLATNGVGFVELTVYSAYASWTPFYRASLDSKQNIVRLDSLISIKQRTGLDFDGTVLTHTAQPSQEVSVPQLNPLVARIYQPEAALLTRAQTDMALFEAEAKLAAPEMIKFEFPAGVSYIGRGKVPSDNQATLLSVASEEIPVKIFPALVPFFEEEAWLLVESIQPVGILLPGSAEFTVDGYLTGHSTLSHPGGDETLSLAFGRSPLITAERTPIVYTERQTWLGRHIRRDGYCIEVTNGTSQTADIEVIDRVPISGHERVKITTKVNPEPYDESDGIITWRLNLGPGESKTISVEYEVDYPDNMELQIH